MINTRPNASFATGSKDILICIVNVGPLCIWIFFKHTYAAQLACPNSKRKKEHKLFKDTGLNYEDLIYLLLRKHIIQRRFHYFY